MSSSASSLLPVGSVLYVEDNATNLALVELLIARRGDLKMLSAITGRKGIEMANEQLPVVILMDIQLPDMSGIDVLKYVRANPATTHIPILALSSDAFPLQIKKAVEAGFFRYLTKPFNIDELNDALDACLSFAAENPLAQ